MSKGERMRMNGRFLAVLPGKSTEMKMPRPGRLLQAHNHWNSDDNPGRPPYGTLRKSGSFG